MIVAVLTVAIITVDVVGDAILSMYGYESARFAFRLAVGISGTILAFIVILAWRPEWIHKRTLP